MKWIKIVFIMLSIILLFMIAFAIINTMISYKYEIGDSSKVEKVDIDFAAGYLKSQITWLWCFGGYVGINIILLLSLMFNKRHHINN